MPLGQQPHVTTTFLVERAVTQELGQAASVTPTSLREAEVPTVAPGLPDLTPTPLAHVLSAPATRPPRLPGRPDTWPAPLQSLRPQPLLFFLLPDSSPASSCSGTSCLRSPTCPSSSWQPTQDFYCIESCPPKDRECPDLRGQSLKGPGTCGEELALKKRLSMSKQRMSQT